MKKRSIGKILKTAVCTMLAMIMIVLGSCTPGETQNTDKPTNAPKMVQVVRLKNDAAKGTFLGVSSVEVVEADENTLPDGYLSKVVDAIGRELTKDAKAGDFVSESMLAVKDTSNNGKNDNGSVTDTEGARAAGYVVVTDYIKIGTFTDVSDDIQKIIDENPQSTIYFPDGEYYISKPIVTSSDPQKAVSLNLATFAIIKATSDWDESQGHMIQLGGKDKMFTTDTVGSCYYMTGGCIDASYRAKGIEIAGGLETSLRYVSIKFATQGLHIAYNEESPSSYADIETVNIVGCNQAESIGILVDSDGNTFTNMRVVGYEVATKANGKNNIFRNLHMLYTYGDNYDYSDSVGFWDTSEGNTYDICYPDNFATGFRTSGHTVSVYNNCYAFWYSKRDGEQQYGFVSDGKFNSIVKNYRVDLVVTKDAKFLVVGEKGGTGIVEFPAFPISANRDNSYKDYLVGKVVWMG